MSDNIETKAKRVRILWGSPDDMPALYANQLFLSHAGETEFHLIFGHLSPPITLGLEEGEIPANVYINPVAKIVISPESMKQFVQVINENYKKFQDKYETEEDSDV